MPHTGHAAADDDGVERRDGDKERPCRQPDQRAFSPLPCREKGGQAVVIEASEKTGSPKASSVAQQVEAHGQSLVGQREREG